jgi:hypothetical protein
MKYEKASMSYVVEPVAFVNASRAAPEDDLMRDYWSGTP